MSNTAQIMNAGVIFVAEGATIDFTPETNVAAGSAEQSFQKSGTAQ